MFQFAPHQKKKKKKKKKKKPENDDVSINTPWEFTLYVSKIIHEKNDQKRKQRGKETWQHTNFLSKIQKLRDSIKNTKHLWSFALKDTNFWCKLSLPIQRPPISVTFISNLKSGDAHW